MKMYIEYIWMLPPLVEVGKVFRFSAYAAEFNEEVLSKCLLPSIDGDGDDEL